MIQFPIYVQPRSFARQSCLLTFLQCDTRPNDVGYVEGRTAWSTDCMRVTGRKPATTIQSARTVWTGTSHGRHTCCNPTLRVRVLAPGTTTRRYNKRALRHSLIAVDSTHDIQISNAVITCSNSTTDWMYARKFWRYLVLPRADVLPMGHSADQESYLTSKLHRFFSEHFDLKQWE